MGADAGLAPAIRTGYAKERRVTHNLPNSRRSAGANSSLEACL
jgi:hypothetical protein